MTGKEIGKGRGGKILSLPLCTVLYNGLLIMVKKVFPEIKLLRFIESFIFPDQSKLMRIFTFFN